MVDVAERCRRIWHDRRDERQCLAQPRGIVELPICVSERLLGPRLGLTAREDRGALGMTDELDLPEEPDPDHDEAGEDQLQHMALMARIASFSGRASSEGSMLLPAFVADTENGTRFRDV